MDAGNGAPVQPAPSLSSHSDLAGESHRYGEQSPQGRAPSIFR